MSHNEGQEDDEVFLNEEEERRLREMDSDQVSANLKCKECHNMKGNKREKKKKTKRK